MAITAVSGQHASADGTGGSFGVAFPEDVSDGGFICVSGTVWYTPIETIVVTDTQSNSYTTAVTSAEVSGGGHTAAVLYAYDVVGGVVTVNCTANSADRSIVIQEYAGVKSQADPLDATTSAVGNSSTVAAGAMNPTGTQLYVGALSHQDNGVTWTATGSFTKVASEITSFTYGPNCQVYEIGTGSKNPGATTGSTNVWPAAGATFTEGNVSTIAVQNEADFDTASPTATSYNLSITTPTAGNMLVAAIAVDKDSGAFTDPTDFTLIESATSAGVSIGVWYKVADGDETQVDFSWTNSEIYSTWCGEYSNVGAFDVSAEANATSNSQTSGTTAALAKNLNIALAFFAVDSPVSGESISKQFTQEHDGAPGGGTPELQVFYKLLDTKKPIETTFSYTSTADETAGVIAIFSEAGGVTQEGYRWRDDNGSETGASWLVAQDTLLTSNTTGNVRIRVILDAAGDPASEQYQLEYQETGDPSTEWKKVT